MPMLGMALMILGYGVFYTGIADFAGHNVNPLETFGLNWNKGGTVDTNQYLYNSAATANMTGQPAKYIATTGIAQVQAV